jgi:Pretoxin HINT domain
VGRWGGQRSSSLLRKRVLDVQRFLEAYATTLSGRADAAPEGLRKSLEEALAAVLSYVGGKFGEAAAKAGFEEGAATTGEVIGLLGGLGLAMGIVGIITSLEGKTSEPSPQPPTPPTPPSPAPSPPAPSPPDPSPPDPSPPSPPVWAGNGNGEPPGVPTPIPDPIGDGSNGCFTPGTLVSTKRGLVPIEKIRVGDLVEAWNAIAGGRESRPVLQTSTAQADSLTTLRIGRQIVSCTPLHRFFTGTWTPARDLQVGDRVLRLDGRWARVNSHSTAPQATPVHNISVQDLRNYAVGSLGLIVHNDKIV